MVWCWRSSLEFTLLKAQQDERTFSDFGRCQRHGEFNWNQLPLAFTGPHKLSQAVVLLSSNTLVISISVFVLFLFTSRWYKLLMRHRTVNIHLIIEEHFERYLDQEEEYLGSGVTDSYDKRHGLEKQYYWHCYWHCKGSIIVEYILLFLFCCRHSRKCTLLLCTSSVSFRKIVYTIEIHVQQYLR